MVPYPTTFYWRNKTKSIPLFILVALSVAVIGVVATLTGSILESIYAVDVRPYEHFSLIVSRDLKLDPEMIGSLERDPTVAEIVPFLDSSIRVTGLFGSEQRRIYALDQAGMSIVFQQLNLKLTSGSLPRIGTNEIVLHQLIMDAKDLEIGDYVGQEVDDQDYLWGKFQVSGIIQGRIPIGIASLEFFTSHWAFDLGDDAFAVMAFPANNDLTPMNQSIASYPEHRVFVRALETVAETYRQESQQLDLLLWIINFALILIISLSVGLLNTIHFLSRMKEYGVMMIIGLDRRSLIRQTLYEVLILVAVGFIGGTLLAWLLTWGISRYIFAPQGVAVGVITWRYLCFTLPIPIFLALFSVVTIGWNITKIDAIEIVEGKD